jgi:hypothetical protein
VTTIPDPIRQQSARRPQHLQLLVLGLAVAVAAVVVIWLLASGGLGGRPSANSGPAIVSQAQLQHFAGSLDHPVYWVGPKPGFSYELTSASGRAWVRYLPAGVSAGDSRASFLVVGTYDQPHAYANLKRAAKRSGSVSRTIADRGLLVYNAQRPTSVYFSYPGAGYQVEVFAPSAETARSLVLAGGTTPIK